jgi:hypothetical protein
MFYLLKFSIDEMYVKQTKAKISTLFNNAQSPAKNLYI